MKTFLEIGVADFDTLIPLAAKGGWTGYCVEPIPRHVKTLREHAGALPVAVCECAISDRTGTIKMVVGDGEKHGEKWADGVSHVIDDNHTGPRLLDNPVNSHLRDGEIEVSCFTLDDFLDKHGIDEVDFCKIDVEGHEPNVFRNYSWRVKPKVIKCEHKHLPGNLLEQILVPQGYTIFVELEDIYCIL